MKANKRRIALSAVSILLVICLLAGGTMAWFTDTEKVNANFQAGILDVSVKPGEKNVTSLEFENLRPMLYDNFYTELKDNGTSKWVNDVSKNGMEPEYYGTVPAYFKPVEIKNEGTLPAYLRLTVEPKGAKELEKCEGEKNIHLSEDKMTVKQDKDIPTVPCANGLASALKIFVYRLDGNNWVKVDGINLNTATKETDKDQYNPNTSLGANETVKYVIAGYLPGETTDNNYQGKHFHCDLIVEAFQTDEGSEATPGDPGDKPTDIPDDAWDDIIASGINVDVHYEIRTKETIPDSTYTLPVKKNVFSYAINDSTEGIPVPEGYQKASVYDTTINISYANGEWTHTGDITMVVQKEVPEIPWDDAVGKDVPVTVHYVDEDGNKLADDGTYAFKGTVKDVYEYDTASLSIPVPDGYLKVSVSKLVISYSEGAGWGGEVTVTLKKTATVTWPEKLTATVHYVDENGAAIEGLDDGKYEFAVTEGTYAYATDAIPAPSGYSKVSVNEAEITISNATGEWVASDVTMKVKQLEGYPVTKYGTDGTQITMTLRDSQGNNPSNPLPVPEAILILDRDLLEAIKNSPNEDVFAFVGDGKVKLPEVEGYTPVPGMPLPFRWIDNEVRYQAGLLYNKTANVSKQSLAKMSAPSRALVTSALNLATASLAATTSTTHFVHNEASLNEVKNHLDATVEMYNNVSLSSNWTPPTEAFTGTFKGNHRTISNLAVSSTGTGVGLFSMNSNVIQDLKIENASVTGSQNVGILAGENTAGATISNCEVSGSVTGAFVDSTQLDGEATAVGGIVGLNEGTVEKSRSFANATGPFGIGSLVGVNAGNVKTSFATGSVNASVSDLDTYYTLDNWMPAKHFGKYQANGGLVGSNYGGTIEDSYADAPSGTVRGFALVGGLVGDNYSGTVKSSWSKMNQVNVSTLLTYSSGAECNHYAHPCVATDSYNGTVSNTYYTGTGGNTSYYGGPATEYQPSGWGALKDLSTLPVGFSTSVWTITNGQPDLIDNPRNGSAEPLPPVEHPDLELDIAAYRVKGTTTSVGDPGKVTITGDLFNAVYAANGAAYQEPIDSDRIESLPAIPEGYQLATSPAQKLNMKWDAAQGKIVVLSVIGVEPTTATPGSNEYSIYTQSDLEAIANKMGATYYLWNDLSLMSNWEPLGWTANADVPFPGPFNGQGFAINNLNADYGSLAGGTYYSNVGLFALNGGMIQDLNVNTGSTGVLGGAKVGIIAGQNTGTIQRCHVSGTLAGLYTQTSEDPNCVGGVTGVNALGATLMQCSSSAEAYGYAYVASLAGQNWGDIKQCYSTGGVNAANTADQIAASHTVYTYMASLVGGNKGTINNSYALVPTSTSIRGTYRIGGLVGANFSGGIVKNSYVVCVSAYTVNNTYAGVAGVGHRCIGYNAGTVSNVFYQSTSQSGVNQGVAKPSLIGNILADKFNASIWNFPANNYPNLKNNKR